MEMIKIFNCNHRNVCVQNFKKIGWQWVKNELLYSTQTPETLIDHQ